MNKNRFMTYAAAIAAIYVILTLPFASFSFGAIQFRIAEALCVLPFFTPAAIPGLFVGCLIANFTAGAAPLDIIFGSLATLIGAVGSYYVRKHQWLVCLPPIISNMIIIPWVLRYAYGAEEMMWFLMTTIAVGELCAVGVLGNILLTALKKYRKVIFGKQTVS